MDDDTRLIRGNINVNYFEGGIFYDWVNYSSETHQKTAHVNKLLATNQIDKYSKNAYKFINNKDWNDSQKN